MPRLGPRDFHLKFRDKHLDELGQKGVTVCNSPYIRYLIYSELKRINQQFTTKIIAHGGNHGSAPSFTYKYNPKVAMTNLNKGRLSKEYVMNHYYSSPEYTGISREDLESLFDPTITHDAKYQIIQTVCNRANDLGLKVFVFNDPRKTIKEICLV